jgi:protein-tyrosine phosphatase
MYRITRVLSVGRFASPERAEELRAAGVTHVLNVSDAPSAVAPSPEGFREVVWVPLEDRASLTAQTIVQLLDTLHRMASEPDSHVYVHCVAGHSRSPTVLWLYLIACGVPPDDAREWITDRSPDAAPGHARMVAHEHVLFARQHGLAKYHPHPRAEVVVPYELG